MGKADILIGAKHPHTIVSDGANRGRRAYVYAALVVVGEREGSDRQVVTSRCAAEAIVTRRCYRVADLGERWGRWQPARKDCREANDPVISSRDPWHPRAATYGMRPLHRHRDATRPAHDYRARSGERAPTDR